MKLCCNCNSEIPKSIIIDNKKRNLQNRTKCLECLPFGSSKYSKKVSPENLKIRKAKNQRDYYHRFKNSNKSNHISLLRETRKRSIVDLINGCQVCGYNRCLRNLAFHHVDDSTKKHNISSREFQFSFKRVKPEFLKCVLVCHNCHGEIHDDLIPVDKILDLHSKFAIAIMPYENWPCKK